MKKTSILIAFTLIAASLCAQQTMTTVNDPLEPSRTGLPAADPQDRNNNFYDNEPTFPLTMNELYIEGEVENPGKVDFSQLTKRSVIVKEALLRDDTGNRFVGAYRFDGYSLFDILNNHKLQKKNAGEFPPIIDLFIEVENDRGEKVVLSWGEIYYPNMLHQVLIATDVMRIVPSKTRDLWPLPATCRLVVGADLISERNISSPRRITVRSYPRQYKVNRDWSPLVSPQVEILKGETGIDRFSEVPGQQKEVTQHTIFYGKGRGIHSTQPFTGFHLKEYLRNKIDLTRENLRSGLVVCAGIDGYRCVYSFSEIANRNDQADIMVVPSPEGADGGRFRIFPACDFFSDRAVKALSEIRFENY